MRPRGKGDSMTAHHDLTIEPDAQGSRYVACCSCGWVSHFEGEFFSA